MRNIALLSFALLSFVGTGCSSNDSKSCTAGTTQECLCAGGAKGVQTCAADGESWGTCAGCSSSSCTAGQSQTCACAGGGQGSQTCNADGLSWSPCSGCPTGGCTPGQSQTCACPAGGQGTQTCNSDGASWSACAGCATAGCAPSQSQPCACPAGGQGTQTCNADGSSWGACGGCPTWLDPGSGLMWQRVAASPNVDWENAAGYCTNLNLAGHTDWRLPTLVELRGLIRGCEKCRVATADCEGCGLLKGPFHGCYWPDEFGEGCEGHGFFTSDTYDSGNAWCVSFVDAYVGRCDKNVAGPRVRCVRVP